MTIHTTIPATLRWVGDIDGRLVLLDQTLLPREIREIECQDVATVWEAIKHLRVRGAPAIGVAAAYALCLAASGAAPRDALKIRQDVRRAADYLATSRPTAVNLFWALARMQRRLAEVSHSASGQESCAALLTEARAIHDEDRRQCHRIGELGAAT